MRLLSVTCDGQTIYGCPNPPRLLQDNTSRVDQYHYGYCWWYAFLSFWLRYTVLFTAVCAAVIIVVILFYISVECFFLQKMTKPTTSIYLQLTAKEMQVYLPFTVLSQDTSYYLFAVSKTMPSIKVIGCIWPSLHFSWPSFSINNLLLETTLDIPHSLPITFAQAKRIHRMQSSGPIVPVINSFGTGYSRLRPTAFINVETS